MSDRTSNLLKKTFHIFLIRMVIWSVSLPTVLLAVGWIVEKADFQWAYDSSPATYYFWKELFKGAYSGVYFAVLFILLWLIGAGIMIYTLLRKVFGYINAISRASDALIDKNVEYIELPAELEEFQNRMNRLKRASENNERLAKEAEQRKNDLVVYLAHDLKTPLTSVIGYLTLLRDENQISEELREKYLSISLEKAERLEDLINEFFEITRFNLTNLILEYSNVNLARLLEQLTFEFEPMLMEKNLKCDLNIVPGTMLKCDVDKMQRVFDNLLRNAVNYSFEGDVIHITVNRKADNIIIKFRNRGNTIPKEKLERIFEQFYRLDTARGSRSGGAGLGLAIAKEIVGLHKGTITARSQDEIIEFEVSLPAS